MHIKLHWLSYIIQALVKKRHQVTTSFDRVHQQLFEMTGCPELVYVSTLCLVADALHSAVLAVTTCLSVLLAVRPSHAGIVSKRLNLS